MTAPRPAPTSAPAPLPEGWTLQPTAGLRVANNWTLLIGGSPTTLVRLSDAGGRRLKRLFAGEPLGSSVAERALARRLELNGMANASPPRQRPATNEAAVAPIAVIIPYYDDREGLERTLASLRQTAVSTTCTIIVVDDGSPRSLHLDEPSTTIIRHDSNRGPAAARNTGAKAAAAETLVFLDAGAEVSHSDLARLVTYLDDPHTAAVAPRIMASPGASPLIAAYERSHSPLDLGATSTLVRPLSPVPYVPSTCLAIRKSSFRDAEGFTEALRFGEDVDLVWRLTAEHSVRYAADLHVTHPARNTIASFARQRFNYGGSAAQLAVRHRDAAAPLVLERWTGCAVALAAAGLPIALPTISAYRSYQLASRLPQDLEGRSATAVAMLTKGQFSMVTGLGKSLARPYSPLVALALLVTGRSPARAVTALIGTRLITHRRPGQAALSVLDDAAYSAGLWRNAIRQRSWRCLIPKIV